MTCRAARHTKQAETAPQPARLEVSPEETATDTQAIVLLCGLESIALEVVVKPSVGGHITTLWVGDTSYAGIEQIRRFAVQAEAAGSEA